MAGSVDATTKRYIITAPPDTFPLQATDMVGGSHYTLVIQW